jgi:hypothetical protein
MTYLRSQRRKFGKGRNLPEFTSDAEIFTTTYQCVAFARFCCGSDIVWIEILLFSPSDSHKSVMPRSHGLLPAVGERVFALPSLTNKCVFPADDFRSNVRLAAWSKAPGTRSKCLIKDASIFDFGEVDHAIYKRVIPMNGAEKENVSAYAPGFISTSNGSTGANNMSAISFEKAWLERPE